MTPTWVVVLVGLAAGLGAGALGTLLTISHERGAELRGRMLDAADEFSTGTIAALQTMRNAAGEIKKDEVPLLDPATGWYRREMETVLDAANEAVDAALAKQARIHLLFGDRTDAGIAATGVISQLRNMMMALEHRPDSIRDHENMSQYSRGFEGAREQHERFNAAARAMITKTWRSSIAERLRPPPASAP